MYIYQQQLCCTDKWHHLNTGFLQNSVTLQWMCSECMAVVQYKARMSVQSPHMFSALSEHLHFLSTLPPNINCSFRKQQKLFTAPGPTVTSPPHLISPLMHCLSWLRNPQQGSRVQGKDVGRSQLRQLCLLKVINEQILPESSEIACEVTGVGCSWQHTHFYLFQRVYTVATAQRELCVTCQNLSVDCVMNVGKSQCWDINRWKLYEIRDASP